MPRLLGTAVKDESPTIRGQVVMCSLSDIFCLPSGLGSWTGFVWFPGADFASQNAYLHEFFSVSIKLLVNYSAGRRRCHRFLQAAERRGSHPE